MALGHGLLGRRRRRGRTDFALDRQRAQGDTLIDTNRASDAAGLADDDAGAVVDEKGRADAGAGVNVDAGA